MSGPTLTRRTLLGSGLAVVATPASAALPVAEPGQVEAIVHTGQTVRLGPLFSREGKPISLVAGGTVEYSAFVGEIRVGTLDAATRALKPFRRYSLRTALDSITERITPPLPGGMPFYAEVRVDQYAAMVILAATDIEDDIAALERSYQP